MEWKFWVLFETKRSGAVIMRGTYTDSEEATEAYSDEDLINYGDTFAVELYEIRENHKPIQKFRRSVDAKG